MKRKVSLLLRSQRCAQIAEQYVDIDQHIKKRRYIKRGDRMAPYKEAVIHAYLKEPNLPYKKLASKCNVSPNTVFRIIKNIRATQSQ